MRGGRLVDRKRALLAVIAVGLAVGGGVVTEIERRRGDALGSPPVVAWILLALAGAALMLTAATPTRTLAPTAAITSLLRSWSNSPARALLLAALACALTSAPLFVRLNGIRFAQEASWSVNNASWILYAAALIFFLAGIALWERGARSPRPPSAGWPAPLPRRTEVLIACALTAVALALRLPRLPSIPPGLWLDEAQNGIVGKELIAPGALHPVFVGGITEMGALYYYVLGAALELDSSTWVLRVIPALAGSVTVPLVYLLAARLYGWRAGLVAGALLAVSSWSITFSRFGMASMAAVALDVAVVLCLVLGMRTGRFLPYATGGVLLGLNLQGYFLARLLPVVLLLVVAHFAIRSRHDLWNVRSGVAVFSAAAVLAFLPMGLFAIQHPAEFQGRPSTASIFSEAGSGGESNAVWKSLREHALMFSYQGDFNGRHNLPGSPMLDWLTAAFFFAGLGACLLRLGRWEYFLPVAWFAAAFAAGAFSILGEAPQSHRSLENAVVTPLIAGIFVGEAWSSFSRGLAGRVMRIVAASTVLVVCAAVAGMNVHKYFVRQSDDAIVWNDMGADKVELAALMRAHAKAGDAIWVSEALVGQPALQFLAPSIEPMRWVGEQALPFAERPMRNVVLGLSPTDWIDIAALERLYPNASYHVHRGPSGSPLLYSVRVPARDIAATRGVLELSADGELRRRKTFSTTGRTSARRRLVATVKVPSFGRYRFGWLGHRRSAARIVVDGQPIAAGASRPLAAGLHEIEVDAPGERGKTGLLWATPGSALRPVDQQLVFDPRRVWPVGLDGDYRVGDHFRGPAQSAQRDPLIGMYFHRIPLGPPFTVEWSGHLYAPTTGRYHLGTRQSDTARVYIDGRPVFSNTKRDELVEAPIRLVEGWHRLRIRYRAVTGNFKTYLYWTPPHRPTSVVPSAFLRPTPQSSEFALLPTLADTTGELRPGRLREADG